MKASFFIHAKRAGKDVRRKEAEDEQSKMGCSLIERGLGGCRAMLRKVRKTSVVTLIRQYFWLSWSFDNYFV